MKEALINIIVDKIKKDIEKKYQGNFELFKINNKDLATFSKISGFDTIATHNLSITENDYSNILKQFEIIYTKQNVIQSQVEETQTQTQPVEPQIEKPKIKEKKKNNKIAGFVDALIIAFITGSFIGIILLNIYSKIAQHI